MFHWGQIELQLVLLLVIKVKNDHLVVIELNEIR